MYSSGQNFERGGKKIKMLLSCEFRCERTDGARVQLTCSQLLQGRIWDQLEGAQANLRQGEGKAGQGSRVHHPLDRLQKSPTRAQRKRSFCSDSWRRI